MLDTPHPPAPPPRAEETQIRRITITLEWIKIIQFCLKIWDPWTFQHTYRLGLMCRWAVSYPKWYFYVFDPKVLLWPSNKKIFLFLHWIPLDYIRLSPERIFDLLTHLRPFQIRLEMETKVQNLTKMSICHRTINHRKIWYVPLDVLICPL